MSVWVETGRDKNAQDAPYAAVGYGPLLFALPIPETEEGPNTPDPAARWKYALDLRQKLQEAIVVQHRPMPAKWDWPLDAPLKLQAPAAVIEWNLDPQSPQLPPKPAMVQDRVEKISLVPYGCTKFRISMFPAILPQSNP